MRPSVITHYHTQLLLTWDNGPQRAAPSAARAPGTPAEDTRWSSGTEDKSSRRKPGYRCWGSYPESSVTEDETMSLLMNAPQSAHFEE